MAEVIFVSNYKKRKWKDSIKFEFDDSDSSAVTYGLACINKPISDKTFEILTELVSFNELDKYIDGLLQENKDFNGFIKALENIKPNEIKLLFAKFDKKYKPFLDAYLLRKLLEKTGTYAWISKEYADKMIKNKPKQQKAEALDYEGFAMFIRYQHYFAVKRMSIVANTEVPEILQTLVSCYCTLHRKAFDFAPFIDKGQEVTEIAKKITKGKRKGFSSLADILKNNKQTGSNPYLLDCVLENLKMYPYIDIHSFNRAFPNFKMKKQKKKKK